MKIAVQLFGHLRTFEHCVPYLKKHLLDLYDCDVFIHTWDKLDHGSKTWHNIESKYSTLEVSQDIIKKVNDYYNPKQLKIESQNFLKEEGDIGPLTLLGYKYMFYSKHQVNCLRQDFQKKNNIQYDYVLVTRHDVKLLERINFLSYEHEFKFYDKSTIHFVMGHHSGFSNKRFFCFQRSNDLFYFAKPNTIDIASKLYIDFKKIYVDYSILNKTNLGFILSPFTDFLIQKGISPRSFRISFCIKRWNDENDIVQIYEGKNPKPIYIMSVIKNTINGFVKLSPKFLLVITKKILLLFNKLKLYIEHKEFEFNKNKKNEEDGRTIVIPLSEQ